MNRDKKSTANSAPSVPKSLPSHPQNPALRRTLKRQWTTTIAQLLSETADLLEISGGDPFRIRSYRRAAEAIESSTTPLSEIAGEPKKLLDIPGIGKGMAANIQEMDRPASSLCAKSCSPKYRPSMLDLLKLPGMGPKIRRPFLGRAADLAPSKHSKPPSQPVNSTTCPAWAQNRSKNSTKASTIIKRTAGAFSSTTPKRPPKNSSPICCEFPGLTIITPAGSLRRGRETVGDLDILVTGPACAEDKVSAAVEYTAAYPPIANLIAKGQNKVSFHLRNGLQVDVRLLPEKLLRRRAAILHRLQDAQRHASASALSSAATR